MNDRQAIDRIVKEQLGFDCASKTTTEIAGHWVCKIASMQGQLEGRNAMLAELLRGWADAVEHGLTLRQIAVNEMRAVANRLKPPEEPNT